MKRVIPLSVMAIFWLSAIVLSHTASTASTQIAHGQTNSTTQTLPDFNFAAAGDWGYNSNTNKTISSMQSKNPELVLGLGDYSYKNTAGCWLQMIDPIDEKTKIIIGNHESEPLSLLNRYMSHFNLTKQYYSFDYQNRPNIYYCWNRWSWHSRWRNSIWFRRQSFFCSYAVRRIWLFTYRCEKQWNNIRCSILCK